MEEDGDSVVFKVSKASGIGLDALNHAIEALCSGISDAVFQIRDNVFEVVIDHLRDPFNGFEFTAACPSILLLEEFPCAGGITVVPEVVEGLFDGISPPHLQSE